MNHLGTERLGNQCPSWFCGLWRLHRVKRGSPYLKFWNSYFFTSGPEKKKTHTETCILWLGSKINMCKGLRRVAQSNRPQFWSYLITKDSKVGSWHFWTFLVYSKYYQQWTVRVFTEVSNCNLRKREYFQNYVWIFMYLNITSSKYYLR